MAVRPTIPTLTSDPASNCIAGSPKLTPVSQRLENVIRHSLERFQYRNAVFLAERLRSQTSAAGHSDAEQEYARYLLALCHYRQGTPAMAWAVLEGCSSIRSRYLFAQCCLDLGRHVECNGALEWLLGEESLAKIAASEILGNRSIIGIGEPDRASVLNLLGRNARAQNRHRLAKKYLKEALDLNPFLWEAFESLCELGVPPDPNSMFSQFEVKPVQTFPRANSMATFHRSRTISNADGSIFSAKHGVQDENVKKAPTEASIHNTKIIVKNEAPDFTLSKPGFFPPLFSGASAISHQSPVSSLEVDSADVEKASVPVGTTAVREAGSTQPASLAGTPVILKRGSKRNLFERTKSSSSLPGLVAGGGGGINKKRLEKSASLLGLPGAGLSQGARSRPPLKLAQTVGSKREASSEEHERKESTTTAMLPPAELGLVQDDEALRTMADIFKVFARAFGLFSLNKFSEAVAEFHNLPYEHLESGWVQCQIAKSKVEMTEYAVAEQHFARARELEPSIHRDMDVYSTCLWHLRKEMALSTLAKDLKDANHQSPEAWVALGNAYSLRHEHEQAVKCFHRAIQLNSRFSYAHSLSGHEYVTNEEYDKAQIEYRAAMSVDPRNYYAWYGMGMVYDKMGKLDLALIHYKEAQKLSPSNGVLLYLLGAIQEKMSRTTEALRSYEEAIAINPNNVVARYRKAKLQADMDQFDESLKELETIKKLSPNESNVFMLQGKILLRLGEKEQALKYLTWALDLDNKSSHTIRDMIEKMDHDPVEGDESYEVKVDAED